jgi:hypothetical protein
MKALNEEDVLGEVFGGGAILQEVIGQAEDHRLMFEHELGKAFQIRPPLRRIDDIERRRYRPRCVDIQALRHSYQPIYAGDGDQGAKLIKDKSLQAVRKHSTD